MINIKYADKYHVAVLNFASSTHPGGSVRSGSRAQEENICRCSNLYEGLTINKCIKEYYEYNRDNYNNGLCTDVTIYLPNVTVFKDDKKYKQVNEYKVDVITCPAPKCYFYDDNEAYNVYLKRIEQIILSAIDNKADCIVLGAWGCGAYKQDPVLISRAFIDNLHKYSGYFKKVLFGIKPAAGWNDDNYTIFLREFKNHYKGNVYEDYK